MGVITSRVECRSSVFIKRRCLDRFNEHKIFKLFFQRNWSPLFLFGFVFSSFSVNYVNVDIKIKSKKRIGVVVVVVSSKKFYL